MNEDRFTPNAGICEKCKNLILLSGIEDTETLYSEIKTYYQFCQPNIIRLCRECSNKIYEIINQH